MTTEQLAALKEVAERAATRQKWTLYNDGTICANVNGGRHSIAKVTFPKLTGSMEDGRHIAAFDPTTCLALLKRIEQAEAEVERLRGFKVDAIRLCRDEATKWQRDSNGYNERDGMAISLIAKAAAGRELVTELERLK